MSNTHSIPFNPLIDAVPVGTASNLARFLSFISSCEDIPEGMEMALIAATDAARHLARVLETKEEAVS